MHFRIITLLFALILSTLATAQDQWPLQISAETSTITIYQPQPESYADGNVTARAAVAWQERGKDPVYGAIWVTGFLEVDRTTRMGTLTRVTVTDVRSPALMDSTRTQQIKDYLNAEIPKYTQPIAIDRLIASLEAESSKRPEYKHDVPTIYYEESASTLVLIDGEPILQPVEGAAFDRVVNTPFLLVATKDHKTYYLGSSAQWYTAPAATGPWTVTTDVPQELKAQVQKEEGAAEAELDANGKPIVPKVVVSTKPAELLQTTGPADMKPIQGTQLLYVTNTDNDIFMDIASQRFYALLSGRWFAAAKLGSVGWAYIDAEKLPADFAKIPEGSPKDGVLASVPGTTASKEAVLDASIPQTAKVDRSATITVNYDGDPKWRLIEGTAIYEAENASTAVLYIREHYYACDNAAWYHSAQSNGPWMVCDEVPAEVKDIPPSSPNYNVKYVQVYESTPQVVYVGYTPGYTGCYVYKPWYGTVYYPPPVTYGFNMHYNPWTGWSMGMTVSNGWMTVHVGGYPGGWWGPPMYRPPYYRPPYHYGGGGYYGGRGNNNTININNSTNINVGGGSRPGGSTRPTGGNLYDQGRNPGVQPSRPGTAMKPGGATGGATTRPAGTTKPAAGNNMYTDRDGNVYRNQGSTWQQQQGNGQFKDVKPTPGTQPGTRPSAQPATKPATRPSVPPATQQQLSRDQQNRDRGQQRVNSYQTRPPSSGGTRGGISPAGGARSGGGARGGGGRR